MSMSIFDININSIETVVLSYHIIDHVKPTKFETDPITLLKKIISDDFEYKDIPIHQMELFDENDNLLSFVLRFPYISLVEYFSKRIFLDSNLESLHEGDYVEFVNSGKKGIVNRLGVGTTQKLVSVMVNNHVYTVLPKNIRKINLDLLANYNEKIDLFNAPYFIKIEIEGRPYSYACFDKEIMIGDYVMVTGKAEAMIHKVKEVIPNAQMVNKNIVTQEVKSICKFDTSAYEERLIKRHKKKFENELNKLLQATTTITDIEICEKLLEVKKIELLEREDRKVDK